MNLSSDAANELFLENKIADVKEKFVRTAHTLEEVLKDFKDYLKRPNRYRLSLVKPYKAPLLPSIENAA